jgi:hypothetical protein
MACWRSLKGKFQSDVGAWSQVISSEGTICCHILCPFMETIPIFKVYSKEGKMKEKFNKQSGGAD